MTNIFNMQLEKKSVKYIVLTVFFIQSILDVNVASAQAQPPQTIPQTTPAPETMEARVNRYLASADVNGDSTITRAEFRDSIIRQNPDRTVQQIDANMAWLFPRFDLDGDGTITRADLVRYFVQNPPGRSPH